MGSKTLLVSRYTNMLPYFKIYFEGLGFPDVHATDKDKDALNMLINDIKPRYLFIESDFYSIATPYMIGEMINQFYKINVTIINITKFPDEKAVWFIYHGVKSYINMSDGLDEFRRGVEAVLAGKEYVAGGVQKIIDELDEYPDFILKETRRQKEVLLMLGNGSSLEHIQDMLHVCKRTVEYHVKQLLQLFHCKTREELVKTAFILDIVTKNDLFFTDGRKEKSFSLPAWAVVQQKINRMNNEKGKGSYEYL